MAKGRFGTVREAGVLDEAATAAELLYTRLCLDLSVKHLCGGEPLHRRGCSLCAESNSLGWQAGIFCLVSDGTARRAREHGSLPQDSQPLRPPAALLSRPDKQPTRARQFSTKSTPAETPLASTAGSSPACVPGSPSTCPPAS